uniref:WGS project CAEQ00000000 data, annotated contig 1707 n=1 Tax=Trypanosoma congolense (strain IL3000) TaxID=1068625 RepID=F9W852_TRYCI|nr:unnamed protein product [Trypanosoma congolense IL3000]
MAFEPMAMDTLRKIVSVKLERLSAAGDETQDGFVSSWQPLRFKLTAALVNEDGQSDRGVMALMAAAGESDFRLLWHRLFHVLRITPSVTHGCMEQKSHEQNGPHDLGCLPHRATRNRALPPDTAGITGEPFTVTAMGMHGGMAVAPVTTTLPAAAENAGRTPDGSTGEIPTHMESVYEFHYFLPDVGGFQDEIVVSFTIMTQFFDESAAEIGHSLVSAGGRTGLLLGPASLALGVCHYRAGVNQPLRCASVSRRVTDICVLSCLTVTNNISAPVEIREVAFDIFSTRVERPHDRGAIGSRSPEQRLGPCGTDLRALKLLQRAISVTPLLLHEHCLPTTLQPEESICFQFTIRVQPHLCHLFTPVTATRRFDASQGETTNGEREPTAVWRPSCVGEAERVPCGELRQVLSQNFTSYLYLHYNPLGAARDGSPNEAASAHHRTIRHPLNWSLLAPEVA